jgi:hypothetical protein
MKWWEMTVGLWVKQLWVRSDGASCSHHRHFFLVQRLRLASLMNSGNYDAVQHWAVRAGCAEDYPLASPNHAAER